MTKTYTNEEIMVELQEIKSMLKMLIDNPKPKRMPVEDFQPDIRTRVTMASARGENINDLITQINNERKQHRNRIKSSK